MGIFRDIEKVFKECRYSCHSLRRLSDSYQDELQHRTL